MNNHSPTEQSQQELFDRIAQRYADHYDDPTSQQYRREFIYGPWFSGVDLSGKNVLEAMCGSGQTTRYLKELGADVTGLDISPEFVERFKQSWPNEDAVCASILDTGIADDSFDAVVIAGGLHHVHPNVDQAIAEIQRILRPGGYFFFYEPHSGSCIDYLRKLWYRYDRHYFEQNESSIDIDQLSRKFEDSFTVEKRVFMGNIAYLFVLNSLIWRIPLHWKKYYAPVLMRIERLIAPLTRSRFTASMCFSCWRKAQ